MTIELVTYATLKAFLELDKEAITDYPALEIIRDDVTDAIEEYIGRLLEQIERTETKFVGATPSQMIYLPGIPIITIGSVNITQAQVVTTITSSDYEITDYGIKLDSKIKNSKIVIVYTGGELTSTRKITRAALRQIIYEWQSKDQMGALSTSTEGGFVSRPELGLLKEVQRMLNSSKHPLRLT